MIKVQMFLYLENNYRWEFLLTTTDSGHHSLIKYIIHLTLDHSRSRYKV